MINGLRRMRQTKPLIHLFQDHFNNFLTSSSKRNLEDLLLNWLFMIHFSSSLLFCFSFSSLSSILYAIQKLTTMNMDQVFAVIIQYLVSCLDYIYHYKIVVIQSVLSLPRENRLLPLVHPQYPRSPLPFVLHGMEQLKNACFPGYAYLQYHEICVLCFYIFDFLQFN